MKGILRFKMNLSTNRHKNLKRWFGLKYNSVKGTYDIINNQIDIYLLASQFKSLSEKDLIIELSKTILHEYIHYIIATVNIKHSNIGEEKIIAKLTGQFYSIEELVKYFENNNTRCQKL